MCIRDSFRTIRKRIDRMDQLAKMKENGTFELLPKKEVAKDVYKRQACGSHTPVQARSEKGWLHFPE